MHLPKFIFLDIDGVLVTRKEVARPYLPDKNHGFNSECVRMLDWLIDRTEASIVISSSWRTGNFRDMQEIFKFRNFKNWEKIIGETERAKMMVFQNGDVGHSVPRGLEIKRWLAKMPFCKYVIFDDDSDMLLEQKPFFIQTSFDRGLLSDEAMRAESILNS